MLAKKELIQKRKRLNKHDKTMVEAFKVLSDLNRYQIFRILSEQSQYSVSNISQILNISLPLTSQHIKILTQAGLIHKERSGKKVFPRLEYSNPFVQTLIQAIDTALSLQKKQ